MRKIDRIVNKKQNTKIPPNPHNKDVTVIISILIIFVLTHIYHQAHKHSPFSSHLLRYGVCWYP